MSRFALVSLAILAFTLTACGGGSSDSSTASTTTPTTTTAATSSLTLPQQLEVVTNEANNSLSSALKMASAFNDLNTDYVNDEQHFHIWNEALQPIDLVNNILCFTEQMRANEFVNEGPYVVLADDARCFSDGENNDSSGSTGQSSGAANTPSYMEVVVDATRTDETEPLEVAVWIPGMATGEDNEAIKFKAVITKGASDTDPFGSFTFNFDFYDTIDAANSTGGGEVRTIDIDDHIGFTLFEQSEHDGFTMSQSASVVMSEDRSEGIALTESDFGGFGSNAFGLAFNADNVLVQTANAYADLPYNSGDDSGICLSRTSFKEAVWRYDLYDADSGARVELNSGFSFRYDSDDDGTADSYGHVGYWGIWTETDGAVGNGDTIEMENPDSDVVTNFTVSTAPGRLIKNTVESLALAEARGIEFTYWDDTAISQNFNQWVVNYLTVADDGVDNDGFYRVAGMNWGEQGPTQTALDTPVAITVSSNEPLHMFSNQLGGGVQYKGGDTVLTFFKEEFVNGSETGTGELLASGTANLVCMDNCPIGTFTADDLQNFDGANSPFTNPASSIDNATAYTFSNTGSNALTLVRTANSEPVRFHTDLSRDSLANSPHNWGVRSGPMVSADVASGLTNTWDVYNPELVTVFYVWETGLEQWNHLTIVKDANDVIQTFDKPIEFTYRHTDANDRSGDARNADGQTFLLNYGGNGDFWGIPFRDLGNGRWYPLFNIDDGVAMGPNDSYVIKAREIEQKMAAANGQCSSLSISDPEAAVPTAVQGSADIGPMPTVADPAPKVIGGELQTASE